MFEPRTDSYDSRKSFERNAFLLVERMRAGTIVFNEELRHTFTGLNNVRELPNKRINLLTIDESVRSMMHMMNMVPQMDDMKNKKEEKEE